MNNFSLQSYKIYKDLQEDIYRYSSDAVENFLNIGRCLKNVKENELYKLEEYESIYDFALEKFGYKSTSVKNFINCFEKYADNPLNLDDDCCINDEFKDFQITSLVELLPVPVEQIKEEYSSDMTVKEIRQRKVVNSLSEELQKTINRYHEVVDMLKKEMDTFNSQFDKPILKYRISSNSTSIDVLDLSCCFEYGWWSLYVYSSFDVALKVNSYDNPNDEEIQNYFSEFLSNVKKQYEYDLKEKEEKEKEKKELEKKKALPYNVFSLQSLIYYEVDIYAMFLYLEYVILHSNKSTYELQYFKYKEKSLYEYPIDYKDVRIGSFTYDKDRKETCLKLNIPDDEVSNNFFDKKHDLYSWTIDTDEKRCNLFSYDLLLLFERVYKELVNYKVRLEEKNKN